MARPKGLNNLSRDFDNWIHDHGYGEYIGRSGKMHLKYRLKNGEVVFFSGTPSKPSAVPNAMSKVRRILGIRSDSVKSGKIRHSKSIKHRGYDGHRSIEDGYPPEVKHWLERVQETEEQIRDLPPHADEWDRQQLVNSRDQYVYNLSRYGVEVTPFSAR